MDLTGKVAVITGGSSGIGAATAKLFANHGANVAIIGRHEARLLAVGDACEAAKGNKPLVLQLDLTIEGNCEEAIRKTVQTFNKIDILVNCAGKAGMTSIFDTNTDIFDELIALNLRVPYKMTQLCAPHLKVTKGNIVNVFGAPIRVRPGFLPFAMIRDALERFTKAGAVELAAEGIRMNAVRPGITRTNFLANLNVDDDYMDLAYDRLAALVPNNVVNLPEEIATTILFVVSDSCRNWVGSNVIVDGASSGIGAATAVELASYGAKLTLVGRNELRLQETSEKCTATAKCNIAPLCIILDLTKDSNCENVVERTVETYGRIDVLVNCAGKILLSSLHDNSMETLNDEVMSINFRVPFLLSQLALPHLSKTKGNIINIGSSMAKRMKPGLMPYIITKTALSLFAKHSAAELQTEGVRINTICPGMTRTNILSNLNFSEKSQKKAYDCLALETPQGKILEPKEVATFVCLVASDLFPNLNSAELLLDGAASLT